MEGRAAAFMNPTYDVVGQERPTSWTTALSSVMLVPNVLYGAETSASPPTSTEGDAADREAPNNPTYGLNVCFMHCCAAPELPLSLLPSPMLLLAGFVLAEQCCVIVVQISWPGAINSHSSSNAAVGVAATCVAVARVMPCQCLARIRRSLVDALRQHRRDNQPHERWNL